jgi:hypothetical protein
MSTKRRKSPTTSDRKVYCPYDGERAVFVDSSRVYKKSYGMIWMCEKCSARVGVHKGSDQPLGRLANAELRRAKIAVHAVFDNLWDTGMTRSEAYKWLARELDITLEECHIGMFNVDRCEQAIAACKSYLKEAESKQPSLGEEDNA